jgi:ubiquinone/menaquinone biosynthesis C-methylase UbiE
MVTDVAIGDSTHVAADAHQLPFADKTFDAVIAQAVLEHVLDPVECVSEIHRVLKPNGWIYAETPFMQQVHMGRYDFSRFTELGHRRLFRRFDEVAVGPAVGPGSALAWSLTYFLGSFARTRDQRRLLMALGQTIFFWFKYFDPILTGDSAHDAAAGFFFLGRKGDQVLADRDLILQYRGGL